MPDYKDIEEKRIKEAENASKAMQALVRIMQAAAYSLFLDWLAQRIETENGRIKYSAANLGKVAGVYVLFSRFFRSYQKTVIGAVLERATEIFRLNREYFSQFSDPAESVSDAAVRLALRRWGYNTATKELIPGGYLENIFSNREIARRVAATLNRAIAAKMPLAEFQKQFRAVFVGKAGAGMLESNWKTNAFDLFQRIDRAANLVYADRLGLKYAVYSGTAMDTTRPFCEARVNRVFSRPEIESWANLEFQGKPKIGYDPFMDCGGFNCRHHLSFISDEIAAVLRPEISN